MCLLSFGWQYRPGSRLELVANRDEFHARPTAPVHWWSESQSGSRSNSADEFGSDVLAGRDLKAGGGWLGVNRQGCFAALTNFREVPVTGLRSRGELVSRFLQSSDPAKAAAAALYAERDEYAGFNLLIADRYEMYYVSNRSNEKPRLLAPGMYGLSNALLDSPWPKSLKTTDALQQEIGGSLESKMSIFADREQAADDELPVTAMPAEWEKLLSSPFICTPDYGTRATTGVSISTSGEVSLSERRFDGAGSVTGTNHFRFRVGC